MSDDLWGLLEQALAVGEDRPAFVSGAASVSYAELAAETAQLALRLADAGVRPGARVAALAPNGRDYLTAYFAAAGLGAVLVPLNFRLAAPELAAVLADAGARVLLLDDAFAELGAAALGAFDAGANVGRRPLAVALASAESLARSTAPEFTPRRSRPEDPAQLYYTSGTTGRPKGVVLTHENVRVHAENAVLELGLSRGDRWAHIAPMFHLADAWATFAVTAVGGSHVALPTFEAGAALRLMATEAVTITNLVPTMLARMVADPSAAELAFPALRLVLSGGAPIARETIRRVLDTFGCDYAQTYGMTETSPYLTLGLLPEHLQSLPSEERLGWLGKTGRAFRGVELEVVDASGERVPADGVSVGEIRVRGRTVTPGYWRQPEATAAAIRDGWLYTGDLAVSDSEGFVDIVDRRKDVILSGGENVYSVEVENVLYRHPALLEAAVYGRPDATWGEAVEAAVVLRSDALDARAASTDAALTGTERADADVLRTFCRAALAGYKVPKRIRFLAELPRLGSGKIDKRSLRQSALEETPKS